MAKAKDEKDATTILVKAIKDHTGKWAAKYFKADDKQSAKAKKLSKVLSEVSFGKSDKTALAKILSEVTGENIVIESEEDIEFKPITAFVLTKVNSTDAKHTYETEKVLLSIGDGTAIDPEGKVGGYIPKRSSIMRPATPEEVDALTAKQLEKLQEEVNIIIPD